jgi:hypothetical protein
VWRMVLPVGGCSTCAAPMLPASLIENCSMFSTGSSGRSGSGGVPSDTGSISISILSGRRFVGVGPCDDNLQRGSRTADHQSENSGHRTAMQRLVIR